MKTILLTNVLVLSLIVATLTSPPGSSAQTPKRDDSLKPFTSCRLDSGLRIVQVDRLPKGNTSRTVETSKGNLVVSLADGYRVMVAYNDKRDWFANIKAEKSFDAEYERDKENVIENLKWAASTSKDLDSPEPVKVSINGHEGYGTSKQALTGNLLGIYLFWSDAHRTIMTIYFINQNVNRKRYQSIEEWRTIRDEFLNTYTNCINIGRNQL